MEGKKPKISYTDLAVQETSNEALTSKSYAASIGYFDDPFIKMMSKSKPKKMYPIINRGTWVRVHSYRRVLEPFVAAEGFKQVVSLGAGMDSTFFYLRNKYPTAKFRYIEVDFPEIVAKKVAVMEKNPTLAKLKEDPTYYSIISCDLRELEKLNEEFVKLKVDKTTPTLIMTECVLVYMDPKSSKDLVQWCGTYFENSALLNYEMINPSDSFGKVMVSNIEERGCKLLGIYEYGTFEQQKSRVSPAYTKVEITTLLEYYSKYADKAEKARVEKIEFFDEYEEWNMLLSHYCLVLATKGTVAIAF